MVRLEPMADTDFGEYVNSIISGYADDMARAGMVPRDKALQVAQTQTAQLLPEGVDTPNAFLWNIVDEEISEKVGKLWVSKREETSGKTGFVYDVVIFEQFRRRGYRRLAFHCLEEMAPELGITSIALNVFAFNTPARALYESLDYTERAIIMAKDLEVD
jgi:ribosomal protein S18 acetylase RimI-like enzyme